MRVRLSIEFIKFIKQLNFACFGCSELIPSYKLLGLFKIFKVGTLLPVFTYISNYYYRTMADGIKAVIVCSFRCSGFPRD